MAAYYNILADSDHKNRRILENFKMFSRFLFNQITYFCIWIASITTFHKNRKKKEHKENDPMDIWIWTYTAPFQMEKNLH